MRLALRSLPQTNFVWKRLWNSDEDCLFWEYTRKFIHSGRIRCGCCWRSRQLWTKRTNSTGIQLYTGQPYPVTVWRWGFCSTLAPAQKSGMKRYSRFSLLPSYTHCFSIGCVVEIEHHESWFSHQWTQMIAIALMRKQFKLSCGAIYQT